MASLVKLSRLHFLLAGFGLYTFGAVWASLNGAPFLAGRFWLGYMIVFTAQLSISFSNDYFDVQVDAMGRPTLISGGSGVLIARPGMRLLAFRIAVGLIVCSLGFGLIYMLIYSMPFWFLGVVLVGNLLGWFYAAPPIRLSYRGLGEISTAFSTSLLIPSLGYLAINGSMDLKGFQFSLPLLLYGLGFILTVEIPDREADLQGHKLTWVVSRGRPFAFQIIGKAFLAGTLSLFCLQWLYSSINTINYNWLGLLSLIPLSAGMISMSRMPEERQAATRLSYMIMLSLVIFFVGVEGYLLASVV